jgi:hypothetical protein
LPACSFFKNSEGFSKWRRIQAREKAGEESPTIRYLQLHEL